MLSFRMIGIVLLNICAVGAACTCYIQRPASNSCINDVRPVAIFDKTEPLRFCPIGSIKLRIGTIRDIAATNIEYFVVANSRANLIILCRVNRRISIFSILLSRSNDLRPRIVLISLRPLLSLGCFLPNRRC